MKSAKSAAKSTKWGSNDSINRNYHARKHGVSLLRYGRNRHNPNFINEFNQHLDTIEANEHIKAVVLTSSDKSWSLGIDLQWMANPDNTPQIIADFMNSIGALFKRIVTFPMPIIAALNGHTMVMVRYWRVPVIFVLWNQTKAFLSLEVDVVSAVLPMFPIINKAD